ncbi:hypothetical protein F4803DRAFT_570177 [Xylaria telfairii]|nr:hypothetical protein F4803DRAFT_570177 [Xylaria telfairii]
MAGTPAAHQRLFIFNPELTESVPVLAEDEVSDITSVLKGIARGTYPRQDAVPRVLNAYNLTTTGARTTWAYFHTEIIRIPVNNEDRDLRIELDDEVIADLDTPWQGMRPEADKLEGDKASYRFICFIHRHPIVTRHTGPKAVYTISIWDREMDWMSWYDMYPHDRATRQQNVEHFWNRVVVPDCRFMLPRQHFVRDKLRWRVNYRACEKAEGALRNTIPPRHTLWTVMAIGLHHMNNGGTERHIHLMSDEFEFFAGSRDSLLPTMFVRMIWLFLRAPKAGEEMTWDGRTDGFNDDDDMRAFFEQFRVIDRLTWLREDLQKILKLFMRHGALDWVSTIDWFFPALRIPPP